MAPVSPRGLSQGLSFLAPIPALRRLVTARWTEEQLVRHYMPSNTGLACQKLTKPPSPQTEVPGAERAEPPQQGLWAAAVKHTESSRRGWTLPVPAAACGGPQTPVPSGPGSALTPCSTILGVPTSPAQLICHLIHCYVNTRELTVI